MLHKGKLVEARAKGRVVKVFFFFEGGKTQTIGK